MATGSCGQKYIISQLSEEVFDCVLRFYSREPRVYLQQFALLFLISCTLSKFCTEAEVCMYMYEKNCNTDGLAELHFLIWWLHPEHKQIGAFAGCVLGRRCFWRSHEGVLQQATASNGCEGVGKEYCISTVVQVPRHRQLLRVLAGQQNSGWVLHAKVQVFQLTWKLCPFEYDLIVRTGETFALKKISCMEGVQVGNPQSTMENGRKWMFQLHPHTVIQICNINNY